jgi:hypothetical protein
MMNNIYDKEFREKMLILKSFENNLRGITVCSVLQNFIKFLIELGFKIEEIVVIINFLLLQFNISFNLKYYHLYHFIKQNNLTVKKNKKEIQGIRI